MELRQLRYFVAVAEELHFRRAAERLYVAQPAVSEQIRKLEVELGVQVFDRTPRGVKLTEAGSALLEEARRMLQLAETAQRAARNAHQRASSRLRIAYPPESLPSAVPRALRRLAAHAPNVEVTLETGPAIKLIDAVRERRADAVITALPAPSTACARPLLGDEHLVAAVPVSDDRGLQPSLTLERVAASRVLLPPRDANPAFHNAVVVDVPQRRASRRSSSSSPSRAPTWPCSPSPRAPASRCCPARSRSATRARASASWTSPPRSRPSSTPR